MFGDVVQAEHRRQLGLQRLLALVHLAHRLADHLDVAHRIVEAGHAEVEVVQPERLLELRRVGLLGDGQHGHAGVEHVVAADLVGAVGQTAGVLVVGRLEQQLGRVRGAAGDDDDVAPIGLLLAVVLDDNFGHGSAGRVGVELDGLRVGQQRDVGMLQRRPHADDFGVGLGVHQARKAVAACCSECTR